VEHPLVIEDVLHTKSVTTACKNNQRKLYLFI